MLLRLHYIDGDTEIVAASIPTYQPKPAIVCGIYRLPANNIEYSQKMCNTIIALHSQYKNHIDGLRGCTFTRFKKGG